MLSTSIAFLSLGCEADRDIAVRVSIPDPAAVESPAAGVGVVALPYDRDSVLASLEARAGTPRPHTAALDSLFRRFRGPFTAYTALTLAEHDLRDSLLQLQRRLDSVTAGSPEHAALSARQRSLSDSLDRLTTQIQRARTELGRARAQFVSRSDSLRRAIRQWEDSTYRGWDGIVESLARASRREPVTDTTDATGWAQFTLSPGDWWLYARGWDTSDPNAEWYWNIPVPSDTDTVLLSSRNGQRRPRY